ncbi:hypothetical protein BC835DRAFT_1028042 [Cytidiella melzeri]|nr:hypothetical protein BC835DRAFT_1028042 [Cytidiella melzeri]
MSSRYMIVLEPSCPCTRNSPVEPSKFHAVSSSNLIKLSSFKRNVAGFRSSQSPRKYSDKNNSLSRVVQHSERSVSDAYMQDENMLTPEHAPVQVFSYARASFLNTYASQSPTSSLVPSDLGCEITIRNDFKLNMSTCDEDIAADLTEGAWEDLCDEVDEPYLGLRQQSGRSIVAAYTQLWIKWKEGYPDNTEMAFTGVEMLARPVVTCAAPCHLPFDLCEPAAETTPAFFFPQMVNWASGGCPLVSGTPLPVLMQSLRLSAEFCLSSPTVRPWVLASRCNSSSVHIAATDTTNISGDESINLHWQICQTPSCAQTLDKDQMWTEATAVCDLTIGLPPRSVSSSAFPYSGDAARKSIPASEPPPRDIPPPVRPPGSVPSRPSSPEGPPPRPIRPSSDEDAHLCAHVMVNVNEREADVATHRSQNVNPLEGAVLSTVTTAEIWN